MVSVTEYDTNMARDIEIPDNQEEDPGSFSSVSRPQTPTENPQHCDSVGQDSLGDASTEDDDEDDTSSCHSGDTVIITAGPRYVSSSNMYLPITRFCTSTFYCLP